MLRTSLMTGGIQICDTGQLRDGDRKQVVASVSRMLRSLAITLRNPTEHRGWSNHRTQLRHSGPPVQRIGSTGPLRTIE